MLIKTLVIAVVAIQLVSARPGVENNQDGDESMHEVRRIKRKIPGVSPDEENTAEFWRKKAQLILNDKLQTKENTNRAKNVILFLGDGMSIPTLAAARAYEGQKKGQTGEENYLSFEEFPYTGLSKTYCVDTQVADSACSATAYLCGIKANMGTIGVTGSVPYSECEPSKNESTHVTSIGRWSQLKNKRTGLVTTTRVTHASPSGVYASVADREWECDTDVKILGDDPKECNDIAYQLVNGETGKNLNVILGGGRGKFLPKTIVDEEGQKGKRSDGVNLIEDWLEQKSGVNAEYVWKRDDLLNLPEETDYVLGLFESSHCNYDMDRTKDDPSLAEMTEAAIKILQKGDDGFFLFVEGGRIDHAHHDTKAHKALDETVAFSDAIRRAKELTNSEDTLIVVTSDHAHTMSVNGYPTRGNDILGISGIADDQLPYSTLSYANGPGYRKEEDGKRHNISEDNMQDKEYKFPSLAPLSSETHGGDDVGIFATGPWAHLYRGVIEQNAIPHIMAYASCVGDGVTLCDQ
ncbi:PREDICTED: membrane-bound alkaline phosphatase-like [Nicrophorus vespilloides]|uniref:Alkaline phosphatase n=1 Tax=Nicrophorus vespilloides TaxID=110193 RepID=A0ABM1N2Y5_NICVS|nr:PREDICTED: membrane-bound alkaline phosphatase-like [Nicrophorus vespilloides]